MSGMIGGLSSASKGISGLFGQGAGGGSLSTAMGGSGGMFNAALGLGASLFGGGGQKSSTAFDSGTMGLLWGMQQQATQDQVDSLNWQADIAIKESIRAAQKTAREGLHFREQQAQGYNSSGFLLEGSPMAVLNETRKLVNEEVDAIAEQGANRAKLIRQQANQVGNEGRASILGQQMKFSSEQASAAASNALSRPNFALSAAKFIGAMAQSGGGGGIKPYSPKAAASTSGNVYGAGISSPYMQTWYGDVFGNDY